MKLFSGYFIFLLFMFSGVADCIGQLREHRKLDTRHTYRHIGVHEGLPESYIGSSFRIPDGRLAVWATDLILWDGAKFDRHHNGDLPYYEIEERMQNAHCIDGTDRLWLKRNNELRVFDLKREQYIDNIDSLLSSMGIKARVLNVFADDSGNMWFNTSRGICCWNKNLGLRKIAFESKSFSGELTGAGISSDSRYAWLVFSNGSLAKLFNETGRIVFFNESMKDFVSAGSQVVIKPVTRDATAVMTDDAVGLVSNATGDFTPLLPQNTNPSHKYTSLEVDETGRIWVSRTKHGLYIISPVLNKIEHHDSFPLISGMNMAQDIQHIYSDTISGGMWLSLHGSGLLYSNERSPHVEYQKICTEAGSSPDEYVNAMLALSTGERLAATSRGVLLMGDDPGAVSRIYPELVGKICRVLYEDRDGTVWIGTFADGIYCVRDGKIKHVYLAVTSRNRGKDYNNIRVLAEDAQGRIWVAVYGVIGWLDEDNGILHFIEDNDNIFRQYGLVSAMLFNDAGDMVVACEKGTFMFDPATGKVNPVLQKIPQNLSRNPFRQRSNSIAYDHDGNLWIGTHIGIFVLTKQGNISFHGIDNGFSSPVHAVYVDKGNNIWAMTASNLYQLELVKGSASDENLRIVSHPYIDDVSLLRGDQLAFCMIEDGKSIIATTLKGYMSVLPQSTVSSVYERNLRAPLFNYLGVSGQTVGVGDILNGRILYDNPLGSSPSIVLDHDENSLTIGFVNLDFDNLSSATYRYMLEGVDDEWVEMSFSGSQGMVNYSGLQPGTYRLRVYCVNGGETLSPEAVFTICVTPPWWLSPWCKILWVLIGVAAIAGLVLWMRMRNRRSLRHAIEKQEEEKRREMDEMKIRFFTNISHELRTPLTMVITPLQSIIDNLPDSSQLHSKLCGIQQNALELLKQINNLLDFRKLEVGAERFAPSPCNIADLTRVVASSFMRGAHERGIDLVVDIPQNRVVADIDKPKMRGVLTNIMSNALKYTPVNGTIKVSLQIVSDTNMVQIDVSDTGIGIPEDEIDKIFERYYRASNSDNGNSTMASSGIGLHMVREYMRMHKGEVSVSSSLGKGSVFTLRLPLQAADSCSDVVPDNSPDDDGRPLVLLAEDNTEFRNFMIEELSGQYRVIGVSDGAAALEQAKLLNPDIIISDVMMPVMNGIELTKAIKSDIKISHIPVVLLTAHANEKDESLGYDAGADAYISKPFNMHVLLTRVSRLIEQRRIRWENFSKHIEVNPSEISITSPDEELIRKALKCVEDHMDDSEFSVEDLSRELAMSTATMYRKLQSITGQTPNNFIKSLRLKRAAQLLRQTTLPVGEIAYRTGFSTPRYFSKLFKEEFGSLPTDYRKGDSEIMVE